MAEPFRYAAFISYASEDTAFARRLHRALEAYRIPASMGEVKLTDHPRAKNRVYPCFRDREELPSGHLGEALQKALNDAGALIVVCSPHAARSEWVDKEIRYFETLGRPDKIFAIIADGEPLASEAGDAQQECFPTALRHAARVRAGEQAPQEVVAGDARTGKDGFRNAWLKQVAGMAGVNLGKLLDRDRAARRARAMQFGAAISAVALGVLTLAAASDSRLQRLDLVAHARQLNRVEGRTLDSHAFAIAALGRASLYAPASEQAKAAAADSGLEARLAADLQGYEYPIDVAPNGNWVQGYNGEDAFRVWNVADGSSFPLNARGLFAQDGTAVVHRDPAGYVVLDLTTNASTTLPFQRMPEPQAKDLMAAGPFVAAYEWGGDNALWDLRTNSRTSLGSIQQLAFTPGGAGLILYGGDRDSAVRILASGRTVPLSAPYHVLTTPYWPGLGAADKRYLVDVSSDRTRAALIDLSDGSRRGLPWPVGAQPARFSDDGAYLALNFPDYTVGVLTVATGQLRHFESGDAFVIDRNHRIFAPGTNSIIMFLVGDNTQHLLDVATGQDRPLGDAHFDNFLFAPDGRHAFSQGPNFDGQLLDLATGIVTSIGRMEGESRFEFTSQGALLLSGPLAQSGAVISRPLSYIDVSASTIREILATDLRRDFHVSPTGNFVAAADPEGVRTIVDLRDFSVRRFGQPFQYGGGIPAFAEQRDLVALQGPDTWAVWDLEAPKPEGSPQSWARTICAQSGRVVRPFTAADRTLTAVGGRPWQACAWRGLASLDGWAQAVRYWAVRLGADWDYAPDECTRRRRGFGCPREQDPTVSSAASARP
jgi:hypothetical protein